MSTELLRSIATIIRHPNDSSNPDQHSFANLNREESLMVLKLQVNSELNKYGREQADQRWEDIWNKLPFLFMFVEFDVVSDFWFEYFEPQQLHSGIDQNGEWYYTSRFLEFLLADLKKQERSLDDQRPWLTDLVKFEQTMFLLGRPILNTRKPDDTRFTAHYQTLEINYDIPKAIELAKKEEDQESTSKIIPESKNIKLLFVRNKNGKPDIYQLTNDDYELIHSKNEIFSKEKKSEFENIGML